MVFGIYSVKDNCAGFGVPIIQDNDAVAMRVFENGCSDPTSVWHSHPVDFHLCRLGSFDSESGDILSYEPKRICSATDFVIVKNKEFDDD